MSTRELKKCYEKLIDTPLVDHISEEDFLRICEGPSAFLRHCQAGDKILMTESLRETVIVIVTGRVHAVQEGSSDTRFIIKTAGPGEALSFTVSKIKNDNLSYFAEAVANDTMLLMLNVKKLIDPWPTAAPESTFLRNILSFMLYAHHTTYQHLVDLSKRTTKEKLMSFLLNTAYMQQSNSFEINMSRKELADYLCVDRSAMSTELTKLKESGFMDYQGNCFELNNDLMQHL